MKQYPDNAMGQYNRIADEILTLDTFSERFRIMDSEPEKRMELTDVLYTASDIEARVYLNLEVKIMMKLDNFINMMTGHFNNKEQFDNMQREGKTYPYAEHINTICNEKILNLPKDFNGKFVVEESYYETNGKRHASPHLFLITEKEDGIVLYSYEIPEGEDKSTFSYDSMKNADYTELKKSEKFTPALYHEKDGIWEGGSTSQFSPVMTFKLWEKFSDSCLEVSESMEVNGKKTFGYDEPIIYKRV